MCYPPEVVKAVANPSTGLPSRSQWLPSIAEVKAACETLIGPEIRRREREARYAATYALLPPPPPDTPEARAAVVARYEREVRPAIVGKAAGLSAEQVKANAEKRLAEFYAERDKPVAISPVLAKSIAEIAATHAAEARAGDDRWR